MSTDTIIKSVSMNTTQYKQITDHLEAMVYTGDFASWGRKAFRNLIELERKQSLQDIVDNLNPQQQNQLMDILKQKKEYTM